MLSGVGAATHGRQTFSLIKQNEIKTRRQFGGMFVVKDVYRFIKTIYDV